ncbi:hypothetical protein AQ611_10130 [Burkholderia singularis]|nr:hypothetical protein AQ611_10130 [Burkholderia sp. Bp7605]
MKQLRNGVGIRRPSSIKGMAELSLKDGKCIGVVYYFWMRKIIIHDCQHIPALHDKKDSILQCIWVNQGAVKRYPLILITLDGIFILVI